MDMIQFILDRGAHKAGTVKVADIPFDAALRAACEVNACGKYGMNYTCPPHVGAIEALIAQAKGYEDLHLFQTIGVLEDSYDFEGMMDASAAHKAITQRIADELPLSNCLVLGAGGCNLCAECGILSGAPCCDPERALASLESYGINVSQTAALAGMKYINGVNTVTYFSGVFVPKEGGV